MARISYTVAIFGVKNWSKVGLIYGNV